MNQSTSKNQNSRKKKFKLLIKLFPLLFILLISISGCEEEEIFIEEEISKEQILNKNPLDQKQKIIELAQGVRERLIDYNENYRKPNHFLRKYGRFDKENIRIVSFPQYSDKLMLIIPFKRKNLKKKKVFIAYYKNESKTYKIISHKKYKKRNRSNLEMGFIENLDLIFDFTLNNLISSKTKIKKQALCYDQTVLVDYTNCTAVVVNSCTNHYRVISIGGKEGDCGNPFGEDDIVIEMDGEEGCPEGYEESEHGVCQPINSDPTDPTGPTDPTDSDNPEGECDELEFDCDTDGGSDDDQQIDKLKTDKLNTTQKQLLDQAIIELQNNCLGKVLYNSINSVNIEVGQTTSYATYTGISNTIRFNTNNDIDAGSLGSELFHAYQQQLYGNLDDIQNDPNHVGGSNIEFEEKAFNIQRDIEDGILESWPGNESLEEWLMNLEIVHGDNNINLSQVELNEWFSALEYFKQYHSGCTKDLYCKPIDYNLKPTAIIKLINNLNSSNCN